MRQPKTHRTVVWMFSTVLIAVIVLASFLACAGSKTGEPTVECRVELDRNVLRAGKTQAAVVKVSLTASRPPRSAERPPVNLAIVLDRSGSMAGAKLEKAKEGAIEALHRLSSKDIFSLVAYDHNVDTIVQAQKATDLEGIIARIRRIHSGGRTALFGGVSQGAAEIRKKIGSDYVHRIILLSDGIANVGPSKPEDLMRLGKALRKEGISVTTVGVGHDYNEDLMTGLSQKSDGNTYFVESVGDLPRIFAAELGDVLNVVVKQVQLVIECPDKIRPIRIVGRDGRITGNKVELSMNQLYGGQEKYVLVEVEVPDKKSGDKLLIARARASYQNAVTGKDEHTSAQALARFSEGSEEVDKSANVKVIRDYALTTNSVAQDRAVSLADKGKTQEAVDELNRSAGRLKEQAKKYSDDQLMQQAVETAQKAAKIQNEGMTVRTRKAIRTESNQQIQQQQAQ